MPALRRESGRPCGCDPSCSHACEGHAAHRDLSTTIIEGAHNALGDGIPIQITGPGPTGDIGLIVGQHWIALPRFVAEDIINELIRRLLPRV